LTAFAGIITFGTMQLKAEELGSTSHHHIWVVVMSIGIASLFRLVVGMARGYSGFFDDRPPKTSSGVTSNVGETQPLTQPGRAVAVDRSQESPEEPDDKFDPKELKRVINEAEDDAFSLIFGFLITQLLVFQAVGHLMPLHSPVHNHKGHTQHDVNIMYAFFAGTLGFLGVLQYIGKCFLDKILASEDETDWKSAFKDCAPLTVLFTASWTALVAVTWQVEIWLHNSPLSSHEMSEVCAAFFLTIAAVLCIVGLDKISDTAERRAYTFSNGTDIDEFHKKSLRFTVRVIRKIIEALAFLVGLSWEKACHGALETVIESIEVLETHRVYSSFGAALILSAYILPAWYSYILPMAEKEVDDHETSINVALVHRLFREGNHTGGKTKAVSDFLECKEGSWSGQEAGKSKSRKIQFRKTLDSLAEMIEKLRPLVGDNDNASPAGP